MQKASQCELDIAHLSKMSNNFNLNFDIGMLPTDTTSVRWPSKKLVIYLKERKSVQISDC